MRNPMPLNVRENKFSGALPQAYIDNETNRLDKIDKLQYRCKITNSYMLKQRKVRKVNKIFL